MVVKQPTSASADGPRLLLLLLLREKVGQGSGVAWTEGSRTEGVTGIYKQPFWGRGEARKGGRVGGGFAISRERKLLLRCVDLMLLLGRPAAAGNIR